LYCLSRGDGVRNVRRISGAQRHEKKNGHEGGLRDIEHYETSHFSLSEVPFDGHLDEYIHIGQELEYIHLVYGGVQFVDATFYHFTMRTQKKFIRFENRNKEYFLTLKQACHYADDHVMRHYLL
jgi:hypothetical protein